MLLRHPKCVVVRGPGRDRFRVSTPVRLTLHPDKNLSSSSLNKMQLLNEAYEVLSNRSGAELMTPKRPSASSNSAGLGVNRAMENRSIAERRRRNSVAQRSRPLDAARPDRPRWKNGASIAAWPYSLSLNAPNAATNSVQYGRGGDGDRRHDFV